jgi:glutamyl-tRNA synthetase
MNIDLYFPNKPEDTQTILKRYPKRELMPDAKVTRIAPSPTGFVHIGTVYSALISERLAHQSKGVFFLRIEDTDKKREVSGATELIVKSLTHYGITMDEGQTISGNEIGEYGPYLQSERKAIYHSFAYELASKGRAYPCFCATEELENSRKNQEDQKIRPGYYAEFATCRNLTDEQVEKNIAEKKPFVIRFKSHGNFNNKIHVNDLIKGDRELSQNDQDIVIIKSDGLPTYHFAHAVDDHLMGTTDVIRGDEWFSSLPLHVELFETLGFPLPRFGHLAPIQKMDGSSRRKLSKRKDKEADVAFYQAEGYPIEAVIEYILNLANSNFEDWRKANPLADNREFVLTLEKLSHTGGSLFDIVKLKSISKEIISQFSSDEVYKRALEWTTAHDPIIAEELQKNPPYAKQIFSIERTGAEKVRKDIGQWSDLQQEIGYFYDSLFTLKRGELKALLAGIEPEVIKESLNLFFTSYAESDNKDTWLEKMRALAMTLGYAPTTKELKADPAKFKGSISEITKIFRVLLTGKAQTPDLYEIMKVMGSARVIQRLKMPE